MDTPHGFLENITSITPNLPPPYKSTRKRQGQSGSTNSDIHRNDRDDAASGSHYAASAATGPLSGSTLRSNSATTDDETFHDAMHSQELQTTNSAVATSSTQPDWKRAVSDALINDTFQALPIHATAITDMQGPYIDVKPVDPRTVDVAVTHQFRAHLNTAVPQLAAAATTSASGTTSTAQIEELHGHHHESSNNSSVHVTRANTAASELSDVGGSVHHTAAAASAAATRGGSTTGNSSDLDEQLQSLRRKLSNNGIETAAITTAATVARADSMRSGRSSLDGYSKHPSPWEINPSEIIIGDRLAVGGFAEVFIGKYQGTFVAVKLLLNVDDIGRERFNAEIELISGLRHPNLLLFMGYVTQPRLAIISEYMHRGSLFKVLRKGGDKPLDIRLQRSVAMSVARGMAYLHSRTPPLLHLDLKSPNILIDDKWRIKVADFGLSRVMHSTMISAGAGAGTPEWMSPEVLRSEKHDEKADVYSYGVVLWEILTGQVPWDSLLPLQVVGAVGFQGKCLDIPEVGDPFLIGMCKRCLSSDPSKRPTFFQIVDELEEHFLPSQHSSMHHTLSESREFTVKRRSSDGFGLGGGGGGNIGKINSGDSSTSDGSAAAAAANGGQPKHTSMVNVAAAAAQMEHKASLGNSGVAQRSASTNADAAPSPSPSQGAALIATYKEVHAAKSLTNVSPFANTQPFDSNSAISSSTLSETGKPSLPRATTEEAAALPTLDQLQINGPLFNKSFNRSSKSYNSSSRNATGLSAAAAASAVVMVPESPTSAYSSGANTANRASRQNSLNEALVGLPHPGGGSVLHGHADMDDSGASPPEGLLLLNTQQRLDSLHIGLDKGFKYEAGMAIESPEHSEGLDAAERQNEEEIVTDVMSTLRNGFDMDELTDGGKSSKSHSPVRLSVQSHGSCSVPSFTSSLDAAAWEAAKKNEVGGGGSSGERLADEIEVITALDSAQL